MATLGEPPMTGSTLTQRDAAICQVDWSIRLLVDHSAPLPAVTLAGAAEELLGKLVTGETALRRFAASLSEVNGRPLSQVINEDLNGLRNWLKHGTNAPCWEVELQGSAVTMIVRAILNFQALGLASTAEMQRFADWLPRVRPDLVGDG